MRMCGCGWVNERERESQCAVVLCRTDIGCILIIILLLFYDEDEDTNQRGAIACGRI